MKRVGFGLIAAHLAVAACGRGVRATGVVQCARVRGTPRKDCRITLHNRRRRKRSGAATAGHFGALTVLHNLSRGTDGEYGGARYGRSYAAVTSAR